jgi:putative endonuclease
MGYFVYLLISEKDETFYTGQTNGLKDRLTRHNRGEIKTTKSRRPWKLVYFEEYPTRAEAMWREWEFKTKWNPERKRKLIASFDPMEIRRILES